MARWSARIELSDFYHTDTPICDKAKRVSRALRQFVETQEARPVERQLDYLMAEDLANDFEMLSQDEGATADDFDAFMSDVYDWADYERVWINTIPTCRNPEQKQKENQQ